MKFFDMTVAVTGEKEESLITQRRPCCKVVTTPASQAGYYPGGDMMAIKTIFDPMAAVILDAQTVGRRDVDRRIDDLTNTVRFKLSGHDLQEMELAYAPPLSSTKDPVNMTGYATGNVTEGSMKPFYLKDLDGTPEGAIRLGVRIVEEYIGGIIPDFINILLDSLRGRMDELSLVRNIYITYQIGLRGYLVQRILDQAGVRTWNLNSRYRFYEMMAKDEQSMATAVAMCAECGMEVDAK